MPGECFTPITATEGPSWSNVLNPSGAIRPVPISVASATWASCTVAMMSRSNPGSAGRSQPAPVTWPGSSADGTLPNGAELIGSVGAPSRSSPA